MTPRPEIILIAAIAEQNRVIGKNGQLPWHISEDLRRFKQLTLGHTVLMGRKTFESILARLGHPLPDRHHLVLTSRPSAGDYESVQVFDSLDEALSAAVERPKLFVIGGEAVFAATLALADRLELTFVEGNYDGDAFFPPYEKTLKHEFELKTSIPRDGYRFDTYVRRSQIQT